MFKGINISYLGKMVEETNKISKQMKKERYLSFKKSKQNDDYLHVQVEALYF